MRLFLVFSFFVSNEKVFQEVIATFSKICLHNHFDLDRWRKQQQQQTNEIILETWICMFYRRIKIWKTFCRIFITINGLLLLLFRVIEGKECYNSVIQYIVQLSSHQNTFCVYIFSFFIIITSIVFIYIMRLHEQKLN